MKRTLLVLAVLISLVVSLFGATFTPAAALGDGSVRLVQAVYISGKGVVFIFEVIGNVGPDYHGTVTLDGQKFTLQNCVKRDDGLLACTAERGLSRFVGSTAHATVNGVSSSAPIISHEFCYPIYDWPPYSITTSPDPSRSSIYHQVGRHCQGSPASAGDKITFYNSEWDASFDYYYVDTPDICYSEGAGYYYPCPFPFVP